VPATLLCAWFLRRLWRQAAGPDLDGSPSAQPKGSRYWRFTAPRAAADILQVALHRLDVVLVAALLGPAQAAVYAAATRFINLVGLSNQALSNVLEPQASALFARRDSLGVMGRYQLTTGWLVALSWPVCLVAMIFPTVILAPFGAGYGVGASVVVPLAASMLFSSACGLVDLVLGMSGRTGWNLANMTVALTLNISLDLLLIPELGIRGAALGWAAAVVVGNLLPILEIRWLLGIHPFGRGTFLAVGLAIGCYGPLPLAARVVWGDRPIALLISVPIATACYLPALLAWAARWRVPRGKDAND
jgi:O-antigen/teichoic acid export membrane protein